MNNISELIDIIIQLNGSATIEQICYVYLNQHKMIIDSSYLNVIENTLKSNADKVFNKDGKWQLVNVGGKISKTNSSKIEGKFFGFDFEQHKQQYGSAYQLINNFIKKYPINKINDLTIEEYDVSQDGSFCRMLRYDLQPVCSMGNAWPTTFELFKNKNGIMCLSKTYENIYGDDYDGAFKAIKKNIVLFLDAASKKDTKTMNNIKLNAAFKYKLAAVYFNDIYYPGAVREYFKQSCNRLGVYFDEENMFNNMIELSNWKNKYEETKNISNHSLMGYADYLIRENLSMSDVKIDNNPYKRK